MLLTRKAVPWAQGASPTSRQEHPHPVPGVPSTRPRQQHSKCALTLCLYEEQSFSLLLWPPVYLLILFCRKTQRQLLYGSLPISFQEEPALLRLLPEGGLEAQGEGQGDKIRNDKLWWDQHEPCLEEESVLVGQGKSSDGHLL